MRHCLYCQTAVPAAETACPACGMPLPAPAEQAAARTQRRFRGFVILLALFCLAMILWLPRSVP